MVPVIIAEELVKLGIGLGVDIAFATTGKVIAEKAAVKGLEKIGFFVGVAALSSVAKFKINDMFDEAFQDINSWLLPDPEDAAKLETTTEEEEEEETK